MKKTSNLPLKIWINMPYIKRDSSGQITALCKTDQTGEGWEVCSDDDPELVVFIETLVTDNALAFTDLGLARVVEDLIDLLIDRDAMRFTDLPAPAQEKLLKRRSLRASMNSLNLLGDDEEDGLI